MSSWNNNPDYYHYEILLRAYFWSSKTYNPVRLWNQGAGKAVVDLLPTSAFTKKTAVNCP